MLIAVDTGGTKTLVAAFSPDGKIATSHKFPTPKNTDDYMRQLVETIRDISGSNTIDGIIVAIPGRIANDIIAVCPNLGWKNYDILSDLRAHFKGVPLLLENDANLGGLGEARLLSPMPRSVLYVTISTGIGMGVIFDGKIEPSLRSSEGGHMMIEYDGTVRDWETFASGQAIYKTYRKFAKDITSKRTWQQIADRISRGFFAIIPIIQPDVVIIGGSMGTHFEKYGDILTGILDEKLPPAILVPRPRFISAKHPEEAVIYGCYFYAIDTFANQKA